MLYRLLSMLILLFMGSCYPSDVSNKYYGCYKEKEGFALINILDYGSFEELCQRAEEIVCHDSIPVIEVKHNNKSSILSLGNSCWKKYICILRKRRNVLKIVDNTVHLGKPLDSLQNLMHRHYHNYGKLEFHSDKPQKATISITYKSNELKELNPLLVDIINVFDSIGIDDLTCLNITLEKDKQI